MVTYWMMFALPLLGGASPFRPDRITRWLVYSLVFLMITLVIGGRDVIGCDWDAYLGHYYRAADLDLGQAATSGYRGYVLLNWGVAQLGFSIYAVNTVCGAIFALGLLAFCQRQPRPWLTLLASIPYLTIVVGMGFTRQATAIGFLMFAYVAFVDRKLIQFVVFIGLASLFHSSAAALAPMAIFIRRGQPLSPIIIGGAASAFLILGILSNALDRYLYAYVESEYEAEGALYRLPLNAAAGFAVLLFRKRWLRRFDDARLYVLLAVAALAVLPFAFILPVMSDRMSMYLLPFQVAVASRIPDLVAPKFRSLTITGVVLAYAASLYVWLTFANHAYCWVPYSSVYF